MKPKFLKRTLLIVFFTILLVSPASFAETQIELSKGQTVYVPVYSNVFSGDRALPFDLAAMLSIRNTDIYNAIKIHSIEYYDNDGKLLREYAEKPIDLGPLASTYIFIKESDEAGGFGAHFIVRWEAAKEINAPIIESVMIGVKSGQGISFVSKGKEITEETK